MGTMNKYLGLKIKELRKSKGFTQSQLAEKINIDAKYLSRIETGLSYPSLKTIEKITEILHIEAGLLFNFAEFKDKDSIISELNYKINNYPLENLKLMLSFSNIIDSKNIK